MRNSRLCLLHTLLVFALVFGALGLATPAARAQDATPDTPPTDAILPDQTPDQVDEEFEIEPMPDAAMLARRPDWAVESNRPFALLVRARLPR